jgi:hypothetical protein
MTKSTRFAALAFASLLLTFLLTLPLALAAGPAVASTKQSSKDPVKLTMGKKGSLTFRAKGLKTKAKFNDIAGCLNSYAPDVRVIDEVGSGSNWYVVAQFITTDGCNPQGVCGAAEASTLMWFSLRKSDLNVIDQQFQIIQSCLSPDQQTVEPWSGKTTPQGTPLLELKNGVLKIKVSSAANPPTTITYNHTTPTKGLTTN